MTTMTEEQAVKCFSEIVMLCRKMDILRQVAGKTWSFLATLSVFALTLWLVPPARIVLSILVLATVGLYLYAVHLHRKIWRTMQKNFPGETGNEAREVVRKMLNNA